MSFNIWSAFSTGANETVYKMVKDSVGNIYFAGEFTSIGGVSANYVAKWNGISFSALGSGLSGAAYFGGPTAAYDLAVDSDDNIYIVGSFSSAGGVSAIGIAKWNGTSFSALGGGSANYAINSVGVDTAGNVWVGGGFTVIDGVSTNYFAKWNGTNWAGVGANDAPYSITQGTSYLYVGGGFTEAGGASANRIAKWDGTTWSALGSGLNNRVYSMIESNGYIIVGGSFTEAGGENASRLALWSIEPTTSITPTPDTLNFGTVISGIPSDGVAIELAIVGSLTAIVVNAPKSFEVSSDGLTWASILSLGDVADDTITIYARAYILSSGAFEADIVISMEELPDITVTVSALAYPQLLIDPPDELSFGKIPNLIAYQVRKTVKLTASMDLDDCVIAVSTDPLLSPFRLSEVGAGDSVMELGPMTVPAGDSFFEVVIEGEGTPGFLSGFIDIRFMDQAPESSYQIQTTAERMTVLAESFYSVFSESRLLNLEIPTGNDKLHRFVDTTLQVVPTYAEATHIAVLAHEVKSDDAPMEVPVALYEKKRGRVVTHQKVPISLSAGGVAKVNAKLIDENANETTCLFNDPTGSATGVNMLPSQWLAGDSITLRVESVDDPAVVDSKSNIIEEG